MLSKERRSRQLILSILTLVGDGFFVYKIFVSLLLSTANR